MASMVDRVRDVFCQGVLEFIFSDVSLGASMPLDGDDLRAEAMLPAEGLASQLNSTKEHDVIDTRI